MFSLYLIFFPFIVPHKYLNPENEMRKRKIIFVHEIWFLSSNKILLIKNLQSAKSLIFYSSDHMQNLLLNSLNSPSNLYTEK